MIVIWRMTVLENFVGARIIHHEEDPNPA